jgi:hypothetical protein
MRTVGLLVASTLLLLGAATPASAQIPSTSKLSVHLDTHYTAGARRIVAAGPQVLKILDLNGEMLAAVHDYKTAYPDGIIVLRIYTQAHYRLQDDPAGAAQDFWDRVLWPPLARLSVDDQQLIDFLEGPNEGDSTPTWGSVPSATWFGQFWAALAPLMQAHGFRPCVGSIPVGNPPGSVQEMESQLEAFTPALYAAQAAGGGWSYHAYSLEYSTDEGIESWYSLRYRRFYDFLNRNHPDLASLPMILSEGGAGRDGWRSDGDAARFEDWLTWFDGEISRDDYVVGVTLFEIGDPQGWPSFDLEPITDWLAAYLASH